MNKVYKCKKKRKTDTENWNTGFLHRIQMKFNMFCNLRYICDQLKSVSTFYGGNNLKPFPTKQLWNLLSFGVSGAYNEVKK